MAGIQSSPAVARRSMIDSQLLPNKVNDGAVVAAMAAIEREKFTPASLAGVAYLDKELPLGGGRTLVEPMVLARLLQAAEIAAGDKVLVVASKSGYEAAVVAHMGANVVSVDSDPAAVAAATAAAAASGGAQPHFVSAPVAQGYAAGGPYDVILVVGAFEVLPPSFAEQLSSTGRIVGVKRVDGIGRAVLVTYDGGVERARDLFDAASSLCPEFAVARRFVF